MSVRLLCRGTRLLAALFAAAVLLPAAAHASVIDMSVEQLARSADAVVVADVGGTSARDAARSAREPHSGRPNIVTDIDLKVTRTLVGRRPTDITLTQPGGVLGDIALEVSEYPQFARGERIIVFLDGQNRVIGGFQGKLRVERGRVSGYGVTVTEFTRMLLEARTGIDPIATALGVPSASQGLSAAVEAALATETGATGDSAGLTTAALGISSISPSKQIAGMGLTVTINGSGFGATRGTGAVDFTDGLSLPATRRAATVTSWTDTKITAVVPQSAASGPVRVTTGTGTTTQLDYQVSFSANGRAFGTLPVRYYINENTGDLSGEGAEIRKAFDTWNAAGSPFRIAYAGTSSVSAYPPQGTDGQNTISFSSSPQGMLAVNYYWYNPTTKQMTESDIIFNDNYTWAANSSYTAFDVQTVALHELGHTVGLDDQYTNTWRVMGAAVQGQNKRVLTADEIAGAVYLYGTDAATPPGQPAVTSPSHPDQNAWYRATTASLSFSAGAGVAGYSYVLDASASTTPDAVSETSAGSATVTLAEGERWFHVRAVSAAGVSGTTTHYRLRTDLTAPATTSNAAATYTAPASVTLAAGDALAGVQATYASLNGAAYSAYSAPISVSAEGTHTLRYYSVDRAGNSEGVKSAVFSIEISDVTPLPVKRVKRVSGSDRYRVAANAALEAHPAWGGVTHVVIASGDDRAAADPLSAAGLAGAYDAPVLLVKSVLVNGALPTATESALVGIKAANGGSVHLHVVGGSVTVPAAVWNRLSALKGTDGTIERISGADRYALSAEIANRVVSKVGSAAVPGVLVANGSDAGAFYDALAASPIAYRTHRPLLLVQRTGVPASVQRVLAGPLAIKTRTVVNATGWVSESTRIAAGAPTRLAASTDRRAAASQIANAAIGAGWLDARRVAVANKLPDALTGGSALGRLGGPLLYTDAAGLDTVAAGWLAQNRSTVTDAYIVGGELSVSPSALDGVIRALGG